MIKPFVVFACITLGASIPKADREALMTLSYVKPTGARLLQAQKFTKADDLQKFLIEENETRARYLLRKTVRSGGNKYIAAQFLEAYTAYVMLIDWKRTWTAEDVSKARMRAEGLASEELVDALTPEP